MNLTQNCAEVTRTLLPTHEYNNTRRGAWTDGRVGRLSRNRPQEQQTVMNIQREIRGGKRKIETEEGNVLWRQKETL